MKNFLLFIAISFIVVTIGCHQPCTENTQDVTAWGDTILVHRVYDSCGDSLNYFEAKLKLDSALISKGKVVHGKKAGEWIYYAYGDRRTVYKDGIETSVKHFREDGTLEQEEILNADSLFEVKTYFRNGKLASESYSDRNGYQTGHAIEYDTLGRKHAEGKNLSQDVLPDTMYMENPEPPHELAPTVVTENGGKHGPWLYFDYNDNTVDTVTYSLGEAVWHGQLNQNWKLDGVIGDEVQSYPKFLAWIPEEGSTANLQFANGNEVWVVGQKGRTKLGTYSLSRDRSFLYTSVDGDNVRVWLRKLESNRLKLIAGGVSVYFINSSVDR